MRNLRGNWGKMFNKGNMVYKFELETNPETKSLVFVGKEDAAYTRGNKVQVIAHSDIGIFEITNTNTQLALVFYHAKINYKTRKIECSKKYEFTCDKVYSNIGEICLDDFQQIINNWQEAGYYNVLEKTETDEGILAYLSNFGFRYRTPESLA